MTENGIAKRYCEHCHVTSLVSASPGAWRELPCPACLVPYGRPITMGLDTVHNPTAPAWPSSETLRQRKAAQWDAFVHPAGSTYVPAPASKKFPNR
jgi:hypothetical protein